MSDRTGALPESSYLDYLPAIFREPDAAGRAPLGQFLLAFEQILGGLEQPPAGFPRGLGQILDGGPGEAAGIWRFFDPDPELPEEQRAPAEFLEWLAGWVALSLREDWSELEKRRFISRIVPLYRLRGTPQGLVEMLNVYTDNAPVSIYEFAEIPDYFEVEIRVLPAGLQASDEVDVGMLISRRRSMAAAIVDREKPAHTFYAFRLLEESGEDDGGEDEPAS